MYGVAFTTPHRRHIWLAGLVLIWHLKIRWTQGIQHFQDRFSDFARFRMAAQFFLAENQLAINGHFKATPLRRNQLPVSNKIFDFTFIQDLVRQTDGTWGVVSSCTVFNSDVHQWLLHNILLISCDNLLFGITPL